MVREVNIGMSYPNGRKEFSNDNNSSGRGAAINDPGIMMSPAPACDPTISNYKGGAERSEYALPAALAAGGIPSIAVLDENAVYEHYMRRLNRVWMKRIKATRGKAGTDPNLQHSSPHFRKLHARPTSVPQFIREMDPVVHPRQRRPPSSGVDPEVSQVAGQACTRARLRPKSAAPVLEGRRPSPAWAEVRDRNLAAIGPGPTSSVRRHDVGDVGAGRHAVFMARPGSAPHLQRRPQRDANLSYLERYQQKHGSSTRLAPGVARLERETHGLLTDCRKAARTRGDTTRCFSEKYRHGRKPKERLSSGGGHSQEKTERTDAALSKSNEKIENLGRGAVVRLVGSLGMGRYAHRFRAFAVTGSDLASCTEEDLIQIGVSFRPHRIRLMREIEQRKMRRSSGDTGRRSKSEASAAETQATCEPRLASTRNHQDVLSSQPPLSESERDSPRVSPGRAELIVDSPPVSKACPVDNREGSSSTNSVGDTERLAKNEALEAKTQATCEPRPASTPNRQGVVSNQAPPPASEKDSPRVSAGYAELVVDSPPVPEACPADNRADPSPMSSSGDTEGHAKSGGLVAETQATCEARPASATCGQDALSNHLSAPASEKDSPRVSLGRTELIVNSVPEACPGDNCVDPFSTSDSGGTEGHAKSGGLVAEAQATCKPRSPSARNLQGALPKKTAPALEKNSPRVSAGSTELSVNSPSVPNSCAPENRADSSSTSTACTAYNDTTPRLQLPAQFAGVQLSAESAADRPRCASPEMTNEGGGGGSRSTEVERSEPLRSGRKRSFEKEEKEGAPCPWEEQDTTKDSYASPNDAAGGATDVAPLAVSPNVSAERRIKSPRTESMAEVPDVSAGDVKAVIDGRESFLRVRVFDQLQQVGTMAGKALEVSWRNNVLSFGVTERDLATGSIHIELCGGGIGAQDLIASGAIPGDVSLQLIYHLRTQSLDKEHSAEERDRAVASTSAEPAATGGKVAVDVRLFAKAGGGDVGVCTLNLNIRPDDGDEPAREAAENSSQRKTPAKAMRQEHVETSAPPPVSLVAAASPVVLETAASASAEAEMAKEVEKAEVAASNDEERKRHLLVLEEVTRHIGTIEEACQLVRRQHELLGIPDVRKGDHIFPIQTGKAPHSGTVDARNVVDAGALPRSRYPSAADEREAVVVLQSQCRRRAARKFAKRRAKERKAASKTSHARQRDFLLKQRRNDAAVTLQSNVRRRISVKAVHRRRNEREEARLFGPNGGAAPAIADDDDIPVPGFTNDLLCDNSRCVDRAVPKVQGTARVCEAKPQATQREANALELRNASLQKEAPDSGSGQSERWDSDSPESAKLQNSARSYAAIKTVDYLQRGTEAESLRRASIVAEEVATEIKRKLKEAQMEEGESWESGSSEAAKLQTTARSYAAIKTIDYLRRASEAESLRQASIVVGEKAIEHKRKVKEAEMEAERHDAASGIQRVARSKQANDHVAVLRQKRDSDHLRTRQLELEQQISAEREAAGCIQRLERSRRAVERAATLRQQREVDVQRDLAVESVKLMVTQQGAAACIQRAGRSKHARLRVTAARRERDIEIERRQKEAEMEAERHGAALGIQCVTRSKQAKDHVAVLRQKRDADSLRARQLELELEMIAQREAAGCIQRLARRHSAVERVASLRQQREIDIQRDLAVELAKLTAAREDAAACIQRAGRSRQARLRVTAARQERDIEIERRQKEAEMEAERHGAALGIQRVARSKQAKDHAAVLRQKRDADNLRARQLELELELIAQREAAECIQRLARKHNAVERVASLRQQRKIDIQRDLAVKSAKREDAAACIQQVARSRQARLRVTAARRERDTEIKRKLQEVEMEAERHHAALGIQCVARSKQASDRVAVLRQRRDADNLRTRQLELELELELTAQREAAERIQRLARRHRAVERVASLRQQREIDIQRDLAFESAKQTAAREDAAVCIQRAGRSRQARLRVTAARQERDIEISRRQKEAEVEAERHRAALGIQRVARSKQASDHVAVLRQKRGTDNLRARQLELELEQELRAQQEAAECIQRLARSHRAVERVASLRQQREIVIQRDLAVESAKRTATQEDAAACIQRVARSRQARLRVTATRRKRDVEIERKLKEAEMEAERHHAVLDIQRVARSKQANDHVAVLRKKRDADNLRTQQLELELIAQREAAERIQRLARRRSAVERVATLRQERDVNIQHDLAVELSKQAAAQEDAASCIQRVGRIRQARLRSTSLREKRETDTRREVEEAELGRETAARDKAAVSIQRSVKSHQTDQERDSAVRGPSEVDVQPSSSEPESTSQASESAADLVSTSGASEDVAELRQEQGTEERREGEVEEEEVEAGVRGEDLQQEERDLQEEAAVEKEPESMSSMFARMMDTARKNSITGVGASGIGLETASALSPFPPQHTEKTEATTLEEASNSSAESNDRVGDAGSAEEKGGEWEGNETSKVVGAPDVSSAFDGSTSAATGADGNGLSGHGAQIEGVRQSSSSESSGWESESSGTSDDSEEKRKAQGALPASDADSGDRTRRERSASSGVDDQHGEDRENNVGVLVPSAEDSTPVFPAVGVTDEVMEFGEGGNLSVESVEMADVTSFSPAEVTTPEGASLVGDNETQSRHGRNDNSAAHGFATMGDDTADRKPQLTESNPRDGEKAVTHRSDSDLPASNATSVDHVSGHFLGEHDVMEEWETHLDEETGRAYYYHTKSGVTTWDHPRGGTGEAEQTSTRAVDERAVVYTEGEVQGVPSAKAAEEGPALVASATATETQPLEAEWAPGVNGGRQEATLEPAQDESDAPGEVHAERVGETVAGRGAAAAPTWENNQSETATDVVESFMPTEENDERLEEVVHSSSAVAVDEGVATGKEEVQWEAIVDPDSGHKYFYNPATRQSTWALPDGVLAMAAANAAAAVAAAASAAEGA